MSKRNINRIITSLLAGVVAFSSLSQEGPRLVLGVIVDQLRGDRVDELLSSMGKSGFMRLLRDGVTIVRVAACTTTLISWAISPARLFHRGLSA